MSNVLLTPIMITRAAIALFTNTNMFLKSIDKQYSADFARAGAKIGNTLNIRLPVDYTVTRGPAASFQDTRETQIPLVITNQDHVDITFTSADLTLSVQDFSERYLMQMMNNLAGSVATAIMSGLEGTACNLVANMSGGVVVNPTSSTILSAQAQLDDNSTPDMNRFIVTDPWTNARVTATLSGLFNPATEISQQYRSGQVKNALGFDWFRDQTVIKHTVGTFSSGGTVNGANQTGNNITVNAITGTLNKGDIIVFAGVNAVNRITKQDTGMLREFVVTANVLTGATSIPIYPAMTPGVGGAAVQYQTVVSAPANGAAMSLWAAPGIAMPAGSTYRKNFAYTKTAITMATADLELPPNTESARAQMSGVSMRYLRQYVIGTDQTGARLDVLYGWVVPRGEWISIVADAL